MLCMEEQHEDGDEDLVVYRAQGISTEEYEKAMYGKLTKTQSEDEEEVKCHAQMTECHWRRKEGNLTKQCLMKNNRKCTKDTF